MAPASGPEDDGYGWRVLSVTSFGVTLTFLNTSTLNVALPSVVQHFHASATAASWLLLSYSLVMTILILVFGRLADLFGRRSLYLAGIALLTTASFACVFAPSVWVLIALRGVQGIGAAAVITNTTAQLVDAFPARSLPLALGLNVTVSSAANVLGPILGGALVSWLGWRAIFWFNVPVGLVGMWWARRTLRVDTGSRSTGERFDYPGALFSTVALTGLVIGVSDGGQRGWQSPLIIGSFVVAALAIAAFVLTESFVRHPLVDFSLFRDRARAMVYLAAFLMSMSQASIVLVTSLYLQSLRGHDAFHAGLGVSALAIGLMLGSPVTGRLARRFPPRILSTTGAGIVACGLGLFDRLLAVDTPLVELSACLFLVGVGASLFATPNTASLMLSVPPDRRGIANGLRSMLQNCAQTLSVSVALVLVTSQLGVIQKRRAYSGDVGGLTSTDRSALLTGFHLTVLVMFVCCLGCMAASLLRGSLSARVDESPPTRAG